mgnify:CR=1 FL=1
MTKDAVKKYTKQLGLGGMILHYISRFLTKAEMQIIGTVSYTHLTLPTIA